MEKLGKIVEWDGIKYISVYDGFDLCTRCKIEEHSEMCRDMPKFYGIDCYKDKIVFKIYENKS